MDLEGCFFNTNNYQLTDELLGTGTFGSVYIARDLDGETYAAKIIDIQDNFNGEQQNLLLRESSILHKLDHPAIIKFIGINFQSFTNSRIFQPTIITEYMPNGSLKENLNNERRSLSGDGWNATKKYIILLGISNAMRYLHNNGIIHRDLKPENILIDLQYFPRICDFGLARCLPDNLSRSDRLALTGQVGTPLYMAPELLYNTTDYDNAVDVYAFGILAYEIVTGNEPYADLIRRVSPFTFADMVRAGRRPEFMPGNATDKMANLLKQCWSENPNNRPSFDEIYKKLSTDFSYFDETIDENEIRDYIDYLEETDHNDHPTTAPVNRASQKSSKPNFWPFLAGFSLAIIIAALIFQFGFTYNKKGEDDESLKKIQKLTDEERINKQKINELQTQIAQLENEIESLTKENNAKKSVIDNLQKEIDSRQQRIDELESQNASKQNEINDLKTKFEEVTKNNQNHIIEMEKVAGKMEKLKVLYNKIEECGCNPTSDFVKCLFKCSVKNFKI
ncbi:hypothetical protein M9Y10_018456 [Tritrichomonas musculus]|uniref:Protein kinase domain-containing protein n=1 Tax=Tritrichomonas musculus TaxID=1915356 RepID=A0ABR2HMQ6_9EUKA